MIQVKIKLRKAVCIKRWQYISCVHKKRNESKLHC